MEKIRVIVVGGVAGGASTAARLRRLREDLEIIIFERGPFVSFANCGLPYYVGDVIKNLSALELMTPELFKARFNIDVRVNHEVIAINRDEKVLAIKNLQQHSVETLSYDYLVLAPGGSPIIPQIPGLNLVPNFVVRNIPDVDNIVNYIKTHKIQHITVIGGGYIGIEMIENFRHRRIAVDLIEMMNQVLMPLDYEMAQYVHQELLFNGVELHLSAKVIEFTPVNERYEIKLDRGNPITTDLVILAAGVKPDTKIAKDAGLNLTSSGHILVDNYLRTSDSSIYAAGDCIVVKNIITNDLGSFALAGPANRQGRIIADNIARFDKEPMVEFSGAIGTYVVRVFDVIVAGTGINERIAKQKKISYEKIYAHPNNHAGYYPGAVPLAMKLIFEKPSGRILGVQVVGGEGTEKRVDVLATVILMNGTVFDLERLELAYSPPFGSAKDPVNMIGFIASNILQNVVKIWHWEDVPHRIDNKDFILDVRTSEEFKLGHFPNAVNIPDTEIRNRFTELPKDRPIYIHCQVGFRAYLVSRILMQKGYQEVYNLTGGYKTWEMATKSLESMKMISHPPKIDIGEQQTGRPADDTGSQKKIPVIDAIGLSCPGPINAMIKALNDIASNEYLQIKTTDTAFISSVKAYIELNPGIHLIKMEKQGNILITTILKTKEYDKTQDLMSQSLTQDSVPKSSRPFNLNVVSEILPKELHDQMNNPHPPAIIIDVREKNEWDHGHIDGAVLIPLGKLESHLKQLEEFKSQLIITVCHSGMRSLMAAKILEKNGFDYIRSLKGGMLAWIRAGFKAIS